MVVWLAGAALPVLAQGERIEALERAFWRCDHAATQGVLDSATAADCSTATEALKARRFGGNFSAMLAWWRERKDDEYRSLAAATQAQRLVMRHP